jgi:hypothetical protein
MQELGLFLRGRLYKGLYYRYKGKIYMTEVVITKKLLPDDLKGIKDNLGEV